MHVSKSQEPAFPRVTDPGKVISIIPESILDWRMPTGAAVARGLIIDLILRQGGLS